MTRNRLVLHLALATWLGMAAAAIGQGAATGAGPPASDQTVMIAMAEPESPEPPIADPPSRHGISWNWLLIPGAIVFYLALQLWILPRLGVPT